MSKRKPPRAAGARTSWSMAVLLAVCVASAGSAQLVPFDGPLPAEAAPAAHDAEAAGFDPAGDPAFESLDPHVLHLRTGPVLTDPAQSLHRTLRRPLDAPSRVVVQLEGPVDELRRARLAEVGVELGQYLPANAFLASLPAGFDLRGALAAVDFVRWVGAFENEWKLSPELGTLEFFTEERIALAESGAGLLTVFAFDGAEVREIAAEIARLPGVELLSFEVSGENGLIEAIVPAGIEPMIAALAGVQWVEDAPEAIERNNSNGWIVQTNASGNTSLWNKGIRGQGQIAGIIDSGINLNHCSFKDPANNPVGPNHRKIVYWFGSTSTASHGTHVAGTIVGDEQPISGSTTHRGMAHLARAAFTNLASITSTNLNTRLVANRNAGARIHTNSWGSDSSNAYTAWTRDVDLFSWNNQDDLVLFAITNLNSTVKNPENAKNCLAVSASQDTPNQASHCVGGYAFTNDGRRKPEIMAPGCSTTSSNVSGTCSFMGMTGTSMATPAVAGAAVLTRQYFTDGWFPTGTLVPGNARVPSGALIKAVLLNSAVDMTGISGFPSTREGWGRVLLENGLFFSGDARKLALVDVRNGASGALTTGQSITYSLNVTSSAQPLKFTLTWTDKEATVNANPAAVNNLNLQVTAPGGAVYRGNVFSGGQSATGGSFDNANNVEQVLRNSPPTGQWLITISAPTVNTPVAQGYALVVTGGW
ncbi:MAG TPA: S8 family serine peptidase [Phycisphaerales bacterium]|nr:S8 family serine peptidase [Phycisphaerales bacterium]HMP36224.1 S8 family serine peptidase [Phycisphaerales bacterium]